MGEGEEEGRDKEGTVQIVDARPALANEARQTSARRSTPVLVCNQAMYAVPSDINPLFLRTVMMFSFHLCTEETDRSFLPDSSTAKRAKFRRRQGSALHISRCFNYICSSTSTTCTFMPLADNTSA